MKGEKIMKTSALYKKTVLSALVAILVASVFCIALYPSTADALSWGGKDAAELWYYAESFLDVANAKQAVDGWDLSKVTEPVVIAVIDTGIDVGHELFDGVLVKNADGDILGYNAYTGADSEGNVNIGDTSEKHGSAVAGIIAMLIKEFGLEDYVKIYPVKANTTGSDSFNFAVLAKALDWAVDNAGASVINMSLGRSKKDYDTLDASVRSAFEVAIARAKAKAVVVAAAGNESSSDSNPANVFYPAGMDGVVSVMNQSKDGGLYSTSNYGLSYGLCAPGESIYTSNGYVADTSRYKESTGTSAATSIVSFATALLKLRFQIEGRQADAPLLAKTVKAFNSKTVGKGELVLRALDLKTIAAGNIDDIDYNYQPPTAITLVHDGKFGTGDYADAICMRADGITPINFFASVLPSGKVDPDVENSVEWSVTRVTGDEETVAQDFGTLATGTQFAFVAPSGGDFIVKASVPFYNVSATQKVHVEFGDYYVGEVRVTLADKVDMGVDGAPDSATLYTNQTAYFALTGVKYLDPSAEIKWFVNGVYQKSGATFDFKPTKSGTYVITAQFGDNAVVDFQYKFTANVVSFILRPLDMSMLVLGVVIAAGTIVAIVTVTLKLKKSRSAHNENKEHKEGESEQAEDAERSNQTEQTEKSE